MNCRYCGSTLRIAQSTFESELNSRDVYNVQLLVCVNPECNIYEPDMDNPTKVAATVKNKLN